MELEPTRILVTFLPRAPEPLEIVVALSLTGDDDDWDRVRLALRERGIVWAEVDEWSPLL